MCMNATYVANIPVSVLFICFFFNDTATTEIYTLSLHDALPISRRYADTGHLVALVGHADHVEMIGTRSEEHTSELQSRRDLVCRLLLEKKNKENTDEPIILCQCANCNRRADSQPT